MTKRFLLTSFLVISVFATSIASAQRVDKLELTFFLGLKDGSESSEGAVVRFIVEEDDESTVIFEEHWAEQEWSDQFAVDLSKWGGKVITLNLTTDPGPARNTGWDWILIGDAKIVADDDDIIFDIGQAVVSGQAELSMLLDGEEEETKGLGNGANCTADAGPCGGEAKPKSFMQHPAWDGRVGNTISRYQIELPRAITQAVEASGKLSTTWGQLKTR